MQKRAFPRKRFVHYETHAPPNEVISCQGNKIAAEMGMRQFLAMTGVQKAISHSFEKPRIKKSDRSRIGKRWENTQN